MKFQTQLKFRLDAKRQSTKIKEAKASTRSVVADDLDSNDAAFEVRTQNFKELSRYVLEDVIACKQDTTLLLCVAKELNERFQNKLTDGARQQKSAGTGGDRCKISGKEHFCLKVSMLEVRGHLELQSGAMQEGVFVRKYDSNDGFTVVLPHTKERQALGGLEINNPIKLTFAWRDLVEDADDILFFGSPFNSTRPFDALFRRKRDAQYIFRVFRHLAVEYKGDTNASSQLYAAYLNSLLSVEKEEHAKTKETSMASLLSQISATTLLRRKFLYLRLMDCVRTSFGSVSWR